MKKQLTGGMNMKKNCRIHKMLSMLLCCVMLLGLLPTAALAVERDAMDAAIETVDIRIDPPSPDSPLDYQAISGDSSYYTVKSVKWYDNTAGSYVQPDTLAVDGHEYEVEIAVSTVSDNRCFRQGYVRGIVNGNRGTAETTYAYDSEVVVKYRFTTAADPVRDIYVDGIDVPRPGCSPDYAPSMNWDNHTVSGSNEGNFTNGVYWYDLANNKTLKPTDTFQAGNKYRIFVDVIPRAGNYFIVDNQGVILTRASVNRAAANVMKYLKEDPAKRLNVYYDFVCEYDEISSVAITGLDAPKEGKAPDYSATLSGKNYAFKTTSASNPFVVNGISWYDETAGNDLTKTAKFIAGHTYTVTVYLVPADGYRFDGSVRGAVNSNTAKVSGQGAEIQVKYTFPGLATNQITSVAIEGVTAPAQGKSPSYVAIVKGEGYSLKARNDAYYKNGICWSIMESSDLPVSGGTTFEGGQKYQITMYLVAEEGYEFSATAGGALNVKATINGKTAAEVMGNKKEIVVTYYFTEATDEAVITSAAVTGIDAPAIGAYPDYTADIADTRYTLEGSNGVREKNGITWINNKTGNAMVVGADKFEAGVSYSVVVGVTAKDGYAFQTDRLNAPQITGSINGELVEVFGQDEYTAYLTYTFEALAANTISSVSVTGINTAAEDPTAVDKTALKLSSDNVEVKSIKWESQKSTDDTKYTVTIVLQAKNSYKFAKEFTATVSDATAEIVSRSDTEATLKYTFNKAAVMENPFTDVATDAYFHDPILWAVGKGITNGTTETTFTPHQTCSQAHILTFLWRSVGKPESNMASPYSNAAVKEGQYFYDAFIWAWEKGLISNTAHDPYAPCSRSDVVTYLWKLEGKPKANPANFTDVAADAPYAQAVAWAVKEGITLGNTATTFNPTGTCTRGQIVTFLYRYMEN